MPSGKSWSCLLVFIPLLPRKLMVVFVNPFPHGSSMELVSLSKSQLTPDPHPKKLSWQVHRQWCWTREGRARIQSWRSSSSPAQKPSRLTSWRDRDSLVSYFGWYDNRSPIGFEIRTYITPWWTVERETPAFLPSKWEATRSCLSRHIPNR